MEASAFEQGLEAGGDPFRGTDGMGEFATEEPVPGVPIADAEGRVADAPDLDAPAAVDAPIPGQVDLDGAVAGEETSVQREQREAEEAKARREAEPDPTPESTSSSSAPEAGAESDQTGESGAPQPDPTAAEADADTPEPGAEDGAEAEPTQAAQPGESGAASAPAAAPGATDASTEDNRRSYLIFAVDSPGTLAEVAWYEDKKGKLVPKGTAGAKRQTVALAHGQPEALAIGYAAMGAPPEGCHLVAVASSYFQVRHVVPDETPIQRVKLKIN